MNTPLTLDYVGQFVQKTTLLQSTSTGGSVSNSLFQLKHCFSFRNLRVFFHRDKTRVQIPAKIFPILKLFCWLFMGPTLGFDTKQRNSFLINFGVLYTKNKILTILFTIKYEKNHTLMMSF